MFFFFFKYQKAVKQFYYNLFLKKHYIYIYFLTYPEVKNMLILKEVYLSHCIDVLYFQN